MLYIKRGCINDNLQQEETRIHSSQHTWEKHVHELAIGSTWKICIVSKLYKDAMATGMVSDDLFLHTRLRKLLSPQAETIRCWVLPQFFWQLVLRPFEGAWLCFRQSESLTVSLNWFLEFWVSGPAEGLCRATVKAVCGAPCGCHDQSVPKKGQCGKSGQEGREGVWNQPPQPHE